MAAAAETQSAQSCNTFSSKLKCVAQYECMWRANGDNCACTFDGCSCGSSYGIWNQSATFDQISMATVLAPLLTVMICIVMSGIGYCFRKRAAKLFAQICPPKLIDILSIKDTEVSAITTALQLKRSKAFDDEMDDENPKNKKNKKKKFTDSDFRGQWMLNVHVERAMHLPRLDASTRDPFLIGYSDPYVRVVLYGNKKRTVEKRTRVESSTLNPAWEQTFCFYFDEDIPGQRAQLLRMDVWDFDLGPTHDFSGRVPDIFLGDLVHQYHKMKSEQGEAPGKPMEIRKALELQWRDGSVVTSDNGNAMLIFRLSLQPSYSLQEARKEMVRAMRLIEERMEADAEMLQEDEARRARLERVMGKGGAGASAAVAVAGGAGVRATGATDVVVVKRDRGASNERDTWGVRSLLAESPFLARADRIRAGLDGKAEDLDLRFSQAMRGRDLEEVAAVLGLAGLSQTQRMNARRLLRTLEAEDEERRQREAAIADPVAAAVAAVTAAAAATVGGRGRRASVAELLAAVQPQVHGTGSAPASRLAAFGGEAGRSGRSTLAGQDEDITETADVSAEAAAAAAVAAVAEAASKARREREAWRSARRANLSAGRGAQPQAASAAAAVAEARGQARDRKLAVTVHVTPRLQAEAAGGVAGQRRTVKLPPRA